MDSEKFIALKIISSVQHQDVSEKSLDVMVMMIVVMLVMKKIARVYLIIVMEINLSNFNFDWFYLFYDNK